MKDFQVINAFHLKILAIVTMLIDHIGMIFFPNVMLFRIVGRVAFIIFAFLLVEGTQHTGNFEKYLLRLLLWAFLSEIPYDIARSGSYFYWEAQNIFWTLFIGVLGVHLIQQAQSIFLQSLIVVLTFVVIDLVKADYGIYALCVIYTFFLLRKKIYYSLILVQLISVVASFSGYGFQYFAFLGLCPILLYNGKQGKKTGNIFYTFYAIHLIFFSIIRYYLPT